MTDQQWLSFVESLLDTLDHETDREILLVELKAKEDYRFAYVQWLHGGYGAARRLLLSALEPLLR